MTEVTKIKAVLSKSTTDQIKSKLLSTEISKLVFDCYITPEQFAAIVSKFNDKEFTLEIKE